MGDDKFVQTINHCLNILSYGMQNMIDKCIESFIQLLGLYVVD